MARLLVLTPPLFRWRLFQCEGDAVFHARNLAANLRSSTAGRLDHPHAKYP